MIYNVQKLQSYQTGFPSLRLEFTRTPLGCAKTGDWQRKCAADKSAENYVMLSRKVSTSGGSMTGRTDDVLREKVGTKSLYCAVCNKTIAIFF